MSVTGAETNLPYGSTECVLYLKLMLDLSKHVNLTHKPQEPLYLCYHNAYD